jgi:hypothetical protein
VSCHPAPKMLIPAPQRPLERIFCVSGLARTNIKAAGEREVCESDSAEALLTVGTHYRQYLPWLRLLSQTMLGATERARAIGPGRGKNKVGTDDFVSQMGPANIHAPK